MKGLSIECDLSQEEETWARSVIGKLQWSPHSHRPDLCYLLGQALANLTRERKKKTLNEFNSIIDRFKEHDDMELKFKPLIGKYELEVYGDSAFKDYNHRGLVVSIRCVSIHIHEVLRQLKQEVIKSTVVTDNLSPCRCLYSDRPTKVERLRKEFA